MSFTDFPDGVTSFGLPQVGAGGLPISSQATYFFVDSVNGSDSFTGGFNDPFATIDFAIGKCTADQGNIIVVKAKHAETISAASGITADVAGISIIGLGEGADRPTLTFSATASTFVISAASVAISNIIGKPSIDSVVSPFVVSGADCTLDIEWQDASSTVEALRAVLTTATADRFTCNLTYIGFTAGNAVVNAIRLVGTDTARINVDFYGVLTTAVVEFVTTACTNVNVTGYSYVSGITDGSRITVDTVTGSTWTADVFDGAAASQFSGGSGAAIASDDVSTINAKIGTITNTGGTATIGAVLGDFKARTVANVLGNQNAFTKADITAATAWTTANSPVTLFTVTGTVLARVFMAVTTGITSTAGTGTLALGTGDNAAVFIAATTADGTNFATGDVWTTTTTAKSGALELTSGWVLINTDDIKVTIATNNMTAGGVIVYCQWIPISSGATVA